MLPQFDTHPHMAKLRGTHKIVNLPVIQLSLVQIMITSACYELRLSTRHTSTHHTHLSKHPTPPLHKGAGVFERVTTVLKTT